MLEVEVSKGALSDLDTGVDVQLEAALLQTVATPALQNFSGQQVLGDGGHDLESAVVSAVEHAPVSELLAVVFEPADCGVHCGGGAVQLLGDLVVGHLQVVVKFPDALDHKSSDLVASQPRLGFGPALDPWLLEALGGQKAASKLLQLFAGRDRSNCDHLRLLLFRKYLLHHCLDHCCSYYVKIASPITAK